MPVIRPTFLPPPFVLSEVCGGLRNIWLARVPTVHVVQYTVCKMSVTAAGARGGRVAAAPTSVSIDSNFDESVMTSTVCVAIADVITQVARIALGRSRNTAG